MSSLSRVFCILGIVSFMGLGLSSCNTFSGMGQDISASGKALSTTADEAKN